MSRRLTAEEFIVKAEQVHGDVYDYSEVRYVNNSTKVRIICSKHGSFEQSPQHHMAGEGCSKCGDERCAQKQRSLREEFIEKALGVHGKLYDYSEVHYVGCKTKIKIRCQKHGIFEQLPDSHIQGRGCPKCGAENAAQKRASSTEGFIKKARDIHGGLYDYSKVICINNYTNVEIRCLTHGAFKQSPANHLQHGCGCPKCVNERQAQRQTSSIEEFTKKAERIHGKNKYDYSRVVYVGAHTKVKIICAKHGVFEQTPNSHSNEGCGCPRCKASKGELQISKILDKLKVEYKQQYRFSDCRNKNPLAFDFYFPEFNLCIEYDGQQHFEPVAFGSMSEGKAVKQFYKTRKNDKIKDDYCLSRGIVLVRIPYFERDKTEETLTTTINKLQQTRSLA